MIRVLHIHADASIPKNTYHINGSEIQAGDGEIYMWAIFRMGIWVRRELVPTYFDPPESIKTIVLM